MNVTQAITQIIQIQTVNVFNVYIVLKCVIIHVNHVLGRQKIVHTATQFLIEYLI